MTWKGQELRATMDYMRAMLAISDADEAQAFLDEWEQENPTARRDAGYLTGYMEHDRAIAARALLRVEHPIIGDLAPERTGRDPTFDELLTLGMAYYQRIIDGANLDEAAADAREAVRTLRNVRGQDG